MVITSDYEGLVAHYRELMNAYEIGTPGYFAYEYVVSMLSPSNGMGKVIQRDSVLVLMHCIETLPWFTSQTEEPRPEQQIKKAIYAEVLKSLKRFLASNEDAGDGGGNPVRGMASRDILVTSLPGTRPVV